MLGGLLGGLIDKEQITRDYIQSALETVAEELNEPFNNFFIMIRPTDAKFNHKYFICKYDGNGLPVKVREITLKEILADE